MALGHSSFTETKKNVPLSFATASFFMLPALHSDKMKGSFLDPKKSLKCVIEGNGDFRNTESIQ